MRNKIKDLTNRLANFLDEEEKRENLSEGEMIAALEVVKTAVIIKNGNLIL